MCLLSHFGDSAMQSWQRSVWSFPSFASCPHTVARSTVGVAAAAVADVDGALAAVEDGDELGTSPAIEPTATRPVQRNRPLPATAKPIHKPARLFFFGVGGVTDWTIPQCGHTGAPP
jgi:hypothetical protein